MKIPKAICLYALLGLPTLFFGQASELIYTKKAHWSYLAFDGQPGIKLPGWHEYSGKDTFFNNVLYFTKHHTTYDDPSKYAYYKSRVGYQWFRFDSSKVIQFSRNDSSERILYDFGLSMGDTFRTSPNAFPDIVMGVGSGTWNGKTIRSIQLQFASWVEGIGLIENRGAADGGVKICQFFLNDTLIFINRPYCGGVGIIEAPFEKSQVKCYPNPAASVITIESSTKVETAEVCDMLGKTVLMAMLPAGISELNISSLSSGVFYIKSKAGVLGKFVVY